MRVLHLTTHLNTGGITVYIQKLIKPLAALGIETYVATSGGDHIKVFEELGAKVFIFPFKTKSELNPRLYWALPKLVQLIKDEKIDLIHAHTRVTQVLGQWLKFMTKIPFTATAHGFYHRRLGRRIFPAWGDKTIAISEGVAEALHDHFKIPREKIATIFNGVDIDDLEAALELHDPVQVRQSYGITTNSPVIGVVARLVADKGHEFLIRAIAVLKHKIPNIKLLVVGEGKFRAHLEQLGHELDLQNHVLFLGNIDDVTRPLSAIDIFVLPATWREGFGLSIIEAMACQKPIIVTNIWALNTLIQNDVTGIMIPPKDTDAIVRSIEKYLSDPIYRDRIARAGKEMVRIKFSIQRMATEIHGFYTELISH